MKKTIIFSLACLLMMSCKKDIPSSFSESDLVGKWEFHALTMNGVKILVLEEGSCMYDQVYEFHEDGTVTANDPCQWNNLTTSKANWEIIGDKLVIDYYVIPGLSVNPTIVDISNGQLTLRQMWGDAVVKQHVFKKTDKAIVDYAADMIGNYEGWMNYSPYYISNTFRGDSIRVGISVTKNNWGNLSVTYKNIDVLGTIKDLRVDSMQTTRYENERRCVLDPKTGQNLLFVDKATQYNIRSRGVQGNVNKDSIYLRLDFSKFERQNPNDQNSPTVEKYYQYQLFHGIK
jgi:hypothetical protein